MSHKLTRPVSISVGLFVAEDFRQEIEGRISAVGLFPDRVIVARMLTGTPGSTEDEPIVIASVALLVNLCAPPGKYEVSIDLKYEKTPPVVHNVVLPVGGSANFIIQIRGFRVVSFGTKRIIARVNGKPHVLEFAVRKGEPVEPVAMPDSSSSPSTRARKRVATTR